MMYYISKIKSSISICFVLFLGINCTSEDPVEKVEEDIVCGVSNPVSNLKWLNDEFKLLAGGPATNGIVLYKYNDKPVIEVQSLAFSSTSIHQYSCDGSKLNFEDPQAFKEYRGKRSEIQVLYGTKVWQ